MTQLPRGQILLETVKSPITRAAVQRYIEECKPGSAQLDVVPRISIVVVAYKEQQSLLALLTVLGKTAAKSNAEIILVDNGLSTTVVAASLPLVHNYIKCASNVGCSGGRNIGAAFCHAPLVAFIDADASVDDEYVSACLHAMEQPSLLAVRGRVLPIAPDGALPSHYDLGSDAGTAPIAAEGASVWRAEMFRNAGGFEASLYGREGPVLCYRLHLLFGYQASAFGYAPEIVLRHNYFESTAHLQAKLQRNAQIIDQVDRAYPLMRLFIATFPQLTKRKPANMLVRTKSHLAAAQVRWHQLVNGDDTLPTEPVCVIVGGSVNASARAEQCLAVQTVRVVAVVSDTCAVATNVHFDWQLHVQNDDWLHPTLIERIGNVFRQHTALQMVAVPRVDTRWRIGRPKLTDLVEPDTFAFAVRNMPKSESAKTLLDPIRDVQDRRHPFVIMPASPILVAQYRPAESLVANAVLALRKQRRQGI
jgi:hypothetical protein